MGANTATPNTFTKHVSALNAATVSATGNGVAVDTLGFDSGWATISINVGAVTGSGAELAVKLQESDASGSGYADITGATFTTIESDTAGTFNKVLTGSVQLNGRKRYLRLALTETGTFSAPMSATAMLSGPSVSTKANGTWEFTVTN